MNWVGDVNHKYMLDGYTVTSKSLVQAWLARFKTRSIKPSIAWIRQTEHYITSYTLYANHSQRRQAKAEAKQLMYFELAIINNAAPHLLSVLKARLLKAGYHATLLNSIAAVQDA